MKLYSLIAEALFILTMVFCVLALWRQPLRPVVRHGFIVVLLAMALTALLGVAIYAHLLMQEAFYGQLMFVVKRLAMVLLVALVAWQFNVRQQSSRYLILVLAGLGMANLVLATPMLSEAVSMLLMALVGKQVLNYPRMWRFYLTVLALGVMTMLPLLPGLSGDQQSSLFHLSLALLICCLTLLLRGYRPSLD